MFAWPLPAILPRFGAWVPRSLSSYFGRRDNPVTGERQDHGAIDIPVDVGTPVWAIGEGTVRQVTLNHGTAGTYVNVEHTNGMWSRYLHLSDVKVKVNDRVKAGVTVGLSGGKPGAYGSGRSTGPHLHLELWQGQPYAGGKPIDPIPYLTSEATALAKKGGWIVIIPIFAAGYWYAKKKGLL